MSSFGRIEIDLTAIAHNVRTIRQALSARTTAQAARLCAVLKADAYSLGAARIAKRLNLLGTDMIAVYSPDQARVLVDAAITTPILILMPVRTFDRSDTLYRAAWHGRLHLSVHDQQNLDAVTDIADRLGITLPVHLAIDTGMSREGAPPEEATALLRGILTRRRLQLAGISTHFCCADTCDEKTRAQAKRFDDWLESVKSEVPSDCLLHLANTFAAFRNPSLHHSMVRVGLALFGYACEEFGDAEAFQLADFAAQLHPAVRWLSQVVHIKTIAAGTSVGYGGTWTAKRQTRLAIIPGGYADGYPLALSNKSQVGIELRDQRRVYAPVIGRVSMDQIAVDLSDIPEREATLGLPVELIGALRDAPNHLPTLAHQADTIAHELLCRISPRIPRTYIAMEEARMSDRDAFRYIETGAAVR